jgi:pimeloyl-ACP methyl ester carboxylesterase
VDVGGLPIFYRTAGDRDAPVILLLHGLPSSSRMYEPLLTRLSHSFRLIAPDYPGFGHSAAPDPRSFSYTFDQLSVVIQQFTEVLHLGRYALFVQDYGGPVGFRLAMAAPERLDALIIQNAVAHHTGLTSLWDRRRAYWNNRAEHEREVWESLFSIEANKRRHVGSDTRLEAYNPDLWEDETSFLSRPGQAQIQLDLFFDYRTNVASYRRWQRWLRDRQPRLLVVWGKYDLSFDRSEPHAYRQDVPSAEVHFLEAGHFALDTAADEVARLTRGFLLRVHTERAPPPELAGASRALNGAELRCDSPRLVHNQ